MNPNGQNQLWSKWTTKIQFRGKGFSMATTKDVLVSNYRKFARKLFGSSAGAFEFKTVRENGGQYLVFVLRIEDLDITPQDPAYVSWISEQSEFFFKHAFGPGVVVTVTGEIMAGSRQDGSPSDQWIILPSIRDLMGGPDANV